MNELLPIASGVIVGLVMGYVTARRRAAVWLVASVVLGALATFVTGEWRASWAFLVVDIPLVGLSAAAAYLVSRRITLYRLEARTDG